jgi:hypothetical protein
MKVSWDYEITNRRKVIKFMFQTTNQKDVQLFNKSKFGLQNKKSADENHYYHDVLVKICAPKKQKK